MFCIILAASSILPIKGLANISKYFGVREFTTGFMVMAIATTLPELFVGISSALKKIPAMSLGNVIGSNIVNLTMILGIVVLIGRGIKIESENITKDAFYMFLITLLPLVLMIDKTLSRIDGGILIFIFIFYMHRLSKRRIESNQKENKTKFTDLFKNFGYLFFGLIIMLVSAYFIVFYGKALALNLGVPAILIGLILIALGTSLPELAFGIRSALSQHKELALGDIIGAIIINITLVLGITSLISPIKADFILFLLSIIFMIVISFIFYNFIKADMKLTIREGLALIMLYILFIIVELNIKDVIA
jgi:cation:H+ antiporter